MSFRTTNDHSISKSNFLFPPVQTLWSARVVNKLSESVCARGMIIIIFIMIISRVVAVYALVVPVLMLSSGYEMIWFKFLIIPKRACEMVTNTHTQSSWCSSGIWVFSTRRKHRIIAQYTNLIKQIHYAGSV